jgi:hypothetical protein
MRLDIPLAGWILSVLTFLVGSIIPILYRRLSYDGISLKQPYCLRAVLQKEQQRESGTITFSTLIKIANARRESLLMENIYVPSLSVSGIRFRSLGTSLHFLRADEIPRLPFSDSDNWIPNAFPLIVRSDEERNIGIDFLFQCSSRDTDHITDTLSNHISAKGLPIRFTINGKYRDYVVRIKRDEAEQTAGPERE